MKNKELIDKWESKTGAPSYEISDFPINPSKNEMYIAGYGVARAEIIEDLKQLDEPQKPIVPQFVADWFEENKDNLDNAIFGYLVFWEERDTDSVLYQWFAKSKNKPIETLVRMKDGYEVEKEPLYYVDFINEDDVHKRLVLDHENGKYNIVDWSDNLIGLVQEMFTEEEIKSFDERFLAFKEEVVFGRGEEG